MIFDQYSRYLATALAVKGISANVATQAKPSILDIGSGPYCLLGSFLPDFEVTYLDPLLADSAPEGVNYLPKSIFELEAGSLKKASIVVGVDTFEHVPPESRRDFFNRNIALASDAVVWAFPCSDTKESIDVDSAVDQSYFDIYGKSYSWLDEHKKYGLPSTKETTKWFEDAGFKVEILKQGRVEWLKELLPLVILLNEYVELKPIIDQVSEYYNSTFAKFDLAESGYRTVLVATREGVNFVRPELLEPNESLKKDWSELRNRLFISIFRTLKFRVFGILQDQGVQIQKLNQLLVEQGDWGIDLTHQISLRDTEIFRLQELISEQVKWNEDLKKKIEEKDQEIKRLQENSLNS